MKKIITNKGNERTEEKRKKKNCDRNKITFEFGVEDEVSGFFPLLLLDIALQNKRDEWMIETSEEKQTVKVNSRKLAYLLSLLDTPCWSAWQSFGDNWEYVTFLSLRKLSIKKSKMKCEPFTVSFSFIPIPNNKIAT